MQMTGFIVGESEKAIALVRDVDIKSGVKPFWVPRKKIISQTELDICSRQVQTDKGDRIGVPVSIDVDDDFLARVGVA